MLNLLWYVSVLPLLLACVLFASPAYSGPAGDDLLQSENISLPGQYGAIIYRINEQSPGQLFIVGISHRDAESLSNHYDTAQAQLEIFRIGEWLHKNLDLELLLPEGYFTGEKRVSVRDSHAVTGEVDTDLLYARLADDSCFVNAEMLLMAQYGMHAAQVEDRNIYESVCNCLGELTRKNCTMMQMEAKLDELQYLQEIRTARMLQEIPSAIEAELRAGTIRNPYAMLTIGLNHLHDIIRYLQKNTIMITPPERGDKRMERYTAELAQLRKGYGITVIIPRTLADDQQLLQATRLDEIVPKGNSILATNAPAQQLQ
ncbi:MAG: hypothetical protein C4563_04585 [Desulfobulbus sp.]|nr:MAG: hypothetical protein C4563_04585 [Desulfobulbus sp.]